MAKQPVIDELDIFSDLGGMVSEINASTSPKKPPKITEVVDLPSQNGELDVKQEISSTKRPQRAEKRLRSNDYVTVKFEVPKEDHKEFMRIFSAIQYNLEARVNLAQLGRGWVTRFITAESELLIAAENQEILKTPNRRDSKDLAEVDQTMAKIQSKAFRRAKPL